MDKHAVYNCTVRGCNRSEINFGRYMDHLKTHLRQKIFVTCPFENCPAEYNILSSFTSHISVKQNEKIKKSNELQAYFSKNIKLEKNNYSLEIKNIY